MRHENREREGPAANGAVLQKHNQGTFDDTAEHALAVEVCAGALGVLLVVPRERAVQLLAGVDPDTFLDPTHRFVLAAVRAAAGMFPTVDYLDPAVVATVIQRRGIPIPPAWRGQPLSELQNLASGAPPAAVADWWWGQVRENATRRAVANVGQAEGARAWL